MSFIFFGVLSAVFLWIKNVRFFILSYFALLFVSFYLGFIDWVGLLGVVVLFFALKSYSLRDRFSLHSFLVVLVMGLLYGLHLMPGFEGFQHSDGNSLSPNAAKFDIWFSLDKFNFGILFIFLVFRQELISSFSQFFVAFISVVYWAVPAIGFVYLLAVLIGYSQFDLTFDSVFFPWAVKNLFFTVLAEEVFFRGLIQRELFIRFGDKMDHLPVFLAGGLFGIAHFGGGLQYVLLSAIAGVVYGYCYKISGRLEMAILAHFSLNSVHFLFFAYPHSVL